MRKLALFASIVTLAAISISAGSANAASSVAGQCFAIGQTTIKFSRDGTGRYDGNSQRPSVETDIHYRIQWSETGDHISFQAVDPSRGRTFSFIHSADVLKMEGKSFTFIRRSC